MYFFHPSHTVLIRSSRIDEGEGAKDVFAYEFDQIEVIGLYIVFCFFFLFFVFAPRSPFIFTFFQDKRKIHVGLFSNEIRIRTIRATGI